MKITEVIKNKKGFIPALIALCAGIMLLVLPTNGTPSTENIFTYDSAEEYRIEIEKNIEEMISSISGVTSCKVMLTFENGYEYYYASDQQVTSGESRKEFVLANVNGNEQPVLIRAKMPEVSGVAVVCKGITANEEFKIINLISALFNLPTNRISVTK